MKIWGLAAGAVVCAGFALTGFAESAQVQQPRVKTAPKTAAKAASTPDQNPPETTISVDITRVNILFTVTDKKGRFVTDLGQDDFEIAENKKPQSVLQFTAESDLPLRIAVLIDTSNSITDRFRFEQQAAIRFMNSVLRPRQDLMMLTAFDSTVEMVTDLTDDMKALEAGIRSMRPGGGTSMYDAIYYAASQKLMMDQPRDKFRRAMIIISDGIDTSSDHTRDQALEMAQKADTVIYAISTNITREEKDGDKILKYLTEETGGQAFFPFKAEDLDQSFENIANVLRHQYNIFYSPNPLVRDGLYHPVALKVKTRKDLVVRARKGYYAPRALSNP